MIEYNHDRAVRVEEPGKPGGIWAVLCRFLPHRHGTYSDYREFDAEGNVVYATGGYACQRCGRPPVVPPWAGWEGGDRD